MLGLQQCLLWLTHHKGGQRWMRCCLSIPVHVLAAVLLLAVMGASCCSKTTLKTFCFWPMWLYLSFYWPQMRFSEGKREERPGNWKDAFLWGATAHCWFAFSGMQYRQPCGCCAVTSFSIHVPCRFPVAIPQALLWVKESLQARKPGEDGCAFIAD